MKIVSDFDGVMTDQREEGARVQTLFRERLQSLAGLSAGDLEALVSRCRVALNGAPTNYGWRSQGRISAYGDEDHFIQNIGLADCMDQFADNGDAELQAIREAVRKADLENFGALSGWAYVEMTKETKAGKLEPLDPAAVAVLRDFLNDGAEVVVVSNSSTARVLDILNDSGLDAVDHTDDGAAQLRVRGGARKFDLGTTPTAMQVNGMAFDVDRPFYAEILEDEKPNAVFGDVFSLDLALPLHLTRADSATYGGMHILLRRQPYTPAWALDLMHKTQEPAAHLAVYDAPEEIPAFLGTVLRS